MSFEDGNFSNWQAYTGDVSYWGITNTLSLIPTWPNFNRHTIYSKALNPGNDPYGNFPLASPDGGQYSVRLGNDNLNAEAERLSYTLTVPLNQPDFTITYYYAVVFEDPAHEIYQQPRFTARVLDIATNQYLPCSSFEYVATSQLPGFKRSAFGTDVYYKEWSPVTINLSEYAGRQIKLEFTTADCTEGGHFGYAYVDLADDCSSAIRGNSYCGAPASLSLKGPGGYDKYNWYSQDLSKLLGTGETLTLTPAPAIGTRLALQVIPFKDFGCLDTLYTVITASELNLQIQNPASICSGVVDLTAGPITLGSEQGLELSYWNDEKAEIPLVNPSAISISGTYFIKAINSSGCTSIKPVTVLVNPLPNLEITNPPAVCAGADVNITGLPITIGSSAGITLSYWKDSGVTIPLVSPSSISVAGVYFIKAMNATGCQSIKPVTVSYIPPPNLVITNPPAACAGTEVNIMVNSVTNGSETDLSLTYWKDNNASIPLLNPDKISLGGEYYIKALNKSGCSTTKAITVIVNPVPQLVVNNPAAVCAPGVVNITSNVITAGSDTNLSLTYWTDASASKSATDPSRISKSGLYYIKAESSFGCFKILPVVVQINDIPSFEVLNPKAVYEPNTIDITNTIIGETSKLTYKFSYSINGSNQVTAPTKITAGGTYYITAVNEFGCEFTSSVTVQISPVPQVFVPTGFTPQLEKNNKLYPFLIGVKTLLNFKIYNKWGNLVYQTNDRTAGWDGYYQSSLHFFDTYTWYLEGIDELDNYFKKSGNSILIR